MNTSTKRQSEFEWFAGTPKTTDYWRTRNTRVLSRKTTFKNLKKLKGNLRQAGSSCFSPKACSDLIAALSFTSK